MRNWVEYRFDSLALLLVGAVALVVPTGYSIGFYLICFVGLATWLMRREPLITSDRQWFYWPLLIYALVLGVMAFSEVWAVREIEAYVPFTLTIFGVWRLQRTRPDPSWFWAGLAIGAIGAAVLSGYQALHLGLRAGGYTSPIQFGNLGLLFGVLCLLKLLIDGRFSGFNGLMAAGLVGGVAASVWSQTRGGWLAVLFILVWILAHATRHWTPLKRVYVGLGMVMLLAVPAMQTDGVVQKRISVAVSEFQAYWESGQQDTSVGARLAMWTVALDSVAVAPWLGHGHQGWFEVRDAAVAEGRLSDFSAKFGHLHNEYLNIAFKRGLVGLFFFLALYLVPMLYFFKPYLHHEDSQVRSLAMAGMVIPMMYMDFGLTQSFLSHNSGRIVLCSLWMCVAGLMLNAVETAKTSNLPSPSH